MINQTPYYPSNAINEFDEKELKFEMVEFAENPEPRW